MSKRKPATASKHVRSPIAAKAQRASQAIVRSPKESRLRSVAAGSTDSTPKRDGDLKQKAPFFQSPPISQQHREVKQTMRVTDSKTGLDFSSATANVRAYQGKLLEMAQANMQFALEFTQRLAAIRSPVEFFRVIEELTSRRIAMFQQYSKEMLDLSTKR